MSEIKTTCDAAMNARRVKNTPKTRAIALAVYETWGGESRCRFVNSPGGIPNGPATELAEALVGSTVNRRDAGAEGPWDREIKSADGDVLLVGHDRASRGILFWPRPEVECPALAPFADFLNSKGGNGMLFLFAPVMLRIAGGAKIGSATTRTLSIWRSDLNELGRQVAASKNFGNVKTDEFWHGDADGNV